MCLFNLNVPCSSSPDRCRSEHENMHRSRVCMHALPPTPCMPTNRGVPDKCKPAPSCDMLHASATDLFLLARLRSPGSPASHSVQQMPMCGDDAVRAAMLPLSSSLCHHLMCPPSAPSSSAPAVSSLLPPSLLTKAC